MSEMDKGDVDVSGLRDFLIAQSCDASSSMTATERAIYALLSLPEAAQAACSRDDLEAVVQTVRQAIEAYALAPQSQDGTQHE